MSRVADLGCCVCRLLGHGETPAEIHHISTGGKSKRAGHREVIPLCHMHHRNGGHGVAIHAGRPTWEAKYKTEAEFLAETLELTGEAAEWE